MKHKKAFQAIAAASLALAFAFSVPAVPAFAAETTYSRGDVNKDGIINHDDVIQVFRYVNGLSSVINEADTDPYSSCILADVNQDLSITIGDAIQISRSINGKSSALEEQYIVERYIEISDEDVERLDARVLRYGAQTNGLVEYFAVASTNPDDIQGELSQPQEIRIHGMDIDPQNSYILLDGNGNSIDNFVVAGTTLVFATPIYYNEPREFALIEVQPSLEENVRVQEVEDMRDANISIVLGTVSVDSDWGNVTDEVMIDVMNYNVTCVNEYGTTIVPGSPKTVTLPGVDMEKLLSAAGENYRDEEEARNFSVIYSYIDEGTNNLYHYPISDYVYDEANQTVTFEFDHFMPYYQTITIAQGGHRQLVVDDEHGPLTWSVLMDDTYGNIIVDENGVAEAWGNFYNAEVTATDGEKSWTWLVNTTSNYFPYTTVVTLGETFQVTGKDGLIASTYKSAALNDNKLEDAGAVIDNGDGTATAVKTGTYQLILGYRYFLEQEGYSQQNVRVTIIDPKTEAFLGTWYRQGENSNGILNVKADGTTDFIYPQYPAGNSTEEYTIAEDFSYISFFGDSNFLHYLDENGNLLQTSYDKNGNMIDQRFAYARIPNIAGWWRSDDSFVEGQPTSGPESYPKDGIGEALSITEYDYAEKYKLVGDTLTILDGEGWTYGDENSPTVYRYNIEDDTFVGEDSNGEQVILHRWGDASLQ